MFASRRYCRTLIFRRRNDILICIPYGFLIPKSSVSVNDYESNTQNHESLERIGRSASPGCAVFAGA